MSQASKLPEILVAAGLLSAEQRAQAERAAAEGDGSFVDAVVRLGLAGEEAVAMAVAKHAGCPLASFQNKLLAVDHDPELAQLVPEDFARANLVLPLSLQKNVLAVAAVDPQNMIVLDNLKVLARRDIQVFGAAKSQLLKAIDRFYQQRGGLDLIAKTIAGSAPSASAAEPPRETRVDLDRMMKSGEGALEAVNIVDAILKQAVSERASDVHLEIFDNEVMLRFRIDGVLHERTAPPARIFPALVSRIKIISKLDIAERRLPQDGMFSLGIHNRQVDIRVSVCPADYGEKVVMRVLDKDAVELNLDRIGLEPRQKEDFLSAAREPHGLIFLTGPTGSGKTTTLYTLLSSIKTPGLNFMTIEDPIEIKLKGITQVQVKAGIGLTFASALRSFLRQDPDVILVGEVRDAETAQTCLRAALTGHLVFSTLHTNDAMTAVVRLIDLGIEPYMLASSLSLVAAQRLVRVLCPKCRKGVRPDPKLLERCLAECSLTGQIDAAKVAFFEPVGCEQCAGTGYRGRIGIYEIYRVNQAMRDVIYHEKGDIAKLKAAAAQAGMWNLRASAWRKVLMGITSAEEALALTTSH